MFRFGLADVVATRVLPLYASSTRGCGSRRCACSRPVRDDLQAHPAVAHVAEQAPGATPTLPLVGRTESVSADDPFLEEQDGAEVLAELSQFEHGGRLLQPAAESTIEPRFTGDAWRRRLAVSDREGACLGGATDLVVDLRRVGIGVGRWEARPERERIGGRAAAL